MEVGRKAGFHYIICRMNKKVKLKIAIAVVGTGNSGKTTALHDLIKKFHDNGNDVFFRNRNNKLIKEFNPKEASKDADRIVNVGNEKIAICPQGDAPELIEKKFKFASENDASIIVYAQRTGGDVFKVVSSNQKVMKFWLVLKYKEKLKVSAEFDEANKVFSNELYDQVMSLVNKIRDIKVSPYQS